MTPGNTVQILAISGSPRTASSNSALVSAAVRLAPAGVEVSRYSELADVPPFNPDLDTDTALAAVARFRAALEACDAILICSPEYAHGVPGVLKNALDWVVGSGELIDKPIALINASTRATHAYASLQETLTTMSGRVIEEASVTIPLEGSKCDADGIARNAYWSGLLTASLSALARAVRLGAARSPNYRITAASLEDLAWLPSIELAAAQLLAGHAPESILSETTSLDVLKRAQRDGHLWIARTDDMPVGFAHVELIEPNAVHLQEIDVHPDHGRRGLGTKLVRQVGEWAASHGYESVTLTTFRDVPWNMPFYARLGFGVVPSEQLSPGLRAVVDDETRRGLDPSRRVVMKRPCSGNRASGTSDLVLTPVEPTPDEVQDLEDRIYEFNSSATDIAGGEWLAFFVRDQDRIVAGICGNTWGGTCEVRQFWVEESRRGRGLGTKLFQAVEREARRRGCTQIVLMTFSFQAPAFYERHGFEALATIDDHPRGHRNLLMRKRLT